VDPVDPVDPIYAIIVRAPVDAPYSMRAPSWMRVADDVLMSVRRYVIGSEVGRRSSGSDAPPGGGPVSQGSTAVGSADAADGACVCFTGEAARALHESTDQVRALVQRVLQRLPDAESKAIDVEYVRSVQELLVAAKTRKTTQGAHDPVPSQSLSEPVECALCAQRLKTNEPVTTRHDLFDTLIPCGHWVHVSCREHYWCRGGRRCAVCRAAQASMGTYPPLDKHVKNLVLPLI